MRFLRHALTLLLLALWLPATSHCALETLATHLDPSCCVEVCSHDLHAPSDDTTPRSDSCGIVESGLVKSDFTEVTAHPPTLVLLACLSTLVAIRLREDASFTPGSYHASHPDEWMRARHLVFRAVAPARAPGSI